MTDEPRFMGLPIRLDPQMPPGTFRLENRTTISAAASRFVAQHGPLREPVASECGHPQSLPTTTEIVGGPEIVARACAACGTELWWNAGEWRRL